MQITTKKSTTNKMSSFKYASLGHLKKCSGSQTMDLKKRASRVFILFFISNPTWEGFLYFVFIFSGLKA